MMTLYTVKAELPLRDGVLRATYTFDTMDERRAFVAGIAVLGGTVKKVVATDTKSANDALSDIKAYIAKKS